MTLHRFIATVFCVGLLRPAPGTWGSLAALILGALLHRAGGFPALALATLIVTPLGFWAVAKAVAGQEEKDPSEIVIDEVAGQWISLMFPSFAFWWAMPDTLWLPWPALLSSFALFRLFDITKPWLVGRADRRDDAAGVMIDDLWAGLFAGAGTILIGVVYHAFLLA